MALVTLKQEGPDVVRVKGRVANTDCNITFNNLYDAGAHCEEYGWQIADNADGLGFKLGSLIVAISEGQVSVDDVIAALNNSTDPAYVETAYELAHAIRERFGK